MSETSLEEFRNVGKH